MSCDAMRVAKFEVDMTYHSGVILSGSIRYIVICFCTCKTCMFIFGDLNTYAARAWNSLPPAVGDAPSLLSLRSRLMTWLFELTL